MPTLTKTRTSPRVNPFLNIKKASTRKMGFILPTQKHFGSKSVPAVASLCDRQTTDNVSELSQFLHEGLIAHPSFYHGFCWQKNWTKVQEGSYEKIQRNQVDWPLAHFYHEPIEGGEYGRVSRLQHLARATDISVFLDYCDFLSVFDGSLNGCLTALSNGAKLSSTDRRIFVAVNLQTKARQGANPGSRLDKEVAAVLQDHTDWVRTTGGSSRRTYSYISNNNQYTTFWLAYTGE